MKPRKSAAGREERIRRKRRTKPRAFTPADDVKITDYSKFKTGLSFADVSHELHNEAEQHYRATGEPMYITRHTVLGRMRQHKLHAWDYYNREYGGNPNNPRTWTPGATRIGKEVDSIDYAGGVHYFAHNGVKMEGLKDGSVRIFHPKRRLWASKEKRR